MVGLLHPFHKVNQSWDRRALLTLGLLAGRSFRHSATHMHTHSKSCQKSKQRIAFPYLAASGEMRSQSSRSPFSHWMCGQPIVMHDALLCARVLYARYSIEVENVHSRPTSQQHFDLLQPERNNNAFNLIPAL